MFACWNWEQCHRIEGIKLPNLLIIINGQRRVKIKRVVSSMWTLKRSQAKDNIKFLNAEHYRVRIYTEEVTSAGDETFEI